tara:strand:+ start:690 stop:1460 length:771 start_codon:yes stop_codon:yes gene_type:complete
MLNNQLSSNGVIKITIPREIISLLKINCFERFSVNSYKELTSRLVDLNDLDFSNLAKKSNRLYNKSTCNKINKWVENSDYLKSLLDAQELRISPLSSYELNLLKNHSEYNLDIFFRIVRKNKMDIGPAHIDRLLWEQSIGTNAEVKIRSNEKRWKIWIPIDGMEQNNSLQFVRGSHLENVPYFLDSSRITQTTKATGAKGSPSIQIEWISKNEANFLSEAWEHGEGALFHDDIVHRGPINRSTELRISAEFTVLAS